MIKVSNLVKKYGNDPVIKGISFELEAGKIYGLLGKNGAGKSTIMNMLTGYLGSTSGDIVINGHSILFEPKEAKRSIGYFPEQPPLYGDMTVEEYLRFSAELKGIAKAEIKESVALAIETTHLEEMRQRLIKNLSKGYKQRVGLAHAIMGNPPVLILDEPTSGLDPYQIIEIRELIKTLAGKRTILLSSHILQEISAICDEIIVISQGRIVACDSPERIEDQIGSKNTIAIGFKGDARKAAAILAAMENVEKLELTAEDTVHVQTKDNKDIREEIFWTFADRGVAIIMMERQMQSLEELFIELTEGTAE